jgi:hypothetical protein
MPSMPSCCTIVFVAPGYGAQWFEPWGVEMMPSML